MLNDPKNLNYFWASLIVEELVRCGVDTFCIAPGSRSAPLAMAVAEGGALNRVVHFDERGGAFYALGHAKAFGRPAAFICTSGSAAANAFPAVVEASQANIPLIIISADRPHELLDTAANQTIDQVKLFGGYTRWHYNFPPPTTDMPPAAVLTAVDQAVHRAAGPPAGPVHLNCAFREPLAPARDDTDFGTYTQGLASWFDGPYTQYALPHQTPSPDVVANMTGLLQQARRGLLVVGALNRPAEIAAAERLAGTLGWPVLPDIASGLRLGQPEAPVVAMFDLLLQTARERDLGTAEVILHVGGEVTSKRLLQFLERTPSRVYVRVADHPMRRDPAHRVSHRLQVDLPSFADAVAAMAGLNYETSWAERLRDASERVEGIVETEVAQAGELSEIAAMRALLRCAPAGSGVFLANSLPIREADTYAASTGSRLRVAVNRGASGIDGNIATAVGFAAGLEGPTAAVVGDLAALHDVNSLGLAAGLKTPFVVVVFNNSGGGIFEFLPIARDNPHFERYFAAPHAADFEAAAKTFGLHFERPTSVGDFTAAVATAYNRRGATVIEVRTDRARTREEHRRINAAVSHALEGDGAREAE